MTGMMILILVLGVVVISEVKSQGELIDGTCYEDNNSRLLDDFHDSATNTPDECIRTCASRGYSYAGVQYTTQCFCGNDEPPASRIRDSSQCDAQCPGDASLSCGGICRMNIYTTVKTGRSIITSRNPCSRGGYIWNPRRRKCIRSKRRPTPGETQAADQVSTTVSPTTVSGPGSKVVECQFEICEKARHVVKIAMLLVQSTFLHQLPPEQKSKFFNASISNGLVVDEQCNKDLLIECNENNQNEIADCLDNGNSNALKNLSVCLDQFCGNCGRHLASALGFDHNSQGVVRFITNAKENLATSKLGNILSTPYQFDDTSVFDKHVHLTYYGELLRDKSQKEINESLLGHYDYFVTQESVTLNSIDHKNVEVAKTVIDSAKAVLSVISDVKDVVLKDIIDQINKININIKGITEKEKQTIVDAKNVLFNAEIDTKKITIRLNALANETIFRVDQMILYLNAVPAGDDMKPHLIEIFLKFQAKKMVEFVDGSLNLLKEAHELYKTTITKLETVKGKLATFQQFVKNLANTNSQQFKAETKKIREEVYIPCCIPFPPACIACAITLETAISSWKSTLHHVNNELVENGNIAAKLATDAKNDISNILTQSALLVNWNIALNEVAQINWKIPLAQVIGFKNVKPEIIATLTNLKNAAVNYLKKE